MNPRRLVPSLIVLLMPLALRAAVEDGAPPPLPQADGVAPVEAPPAADTVAPVRRARRAGAVRDDAPGPFGASLTLSGGYDSNIVLLDDESIAALDTAEDGAAIGIEAKGVWRAVNRPDARLNITLDGELDEYPDLDDRQLVRLGLIVSGLVKWNGWSPGGSIGAHRYLLDGDEAADVLTATATCSRIAPTWVAIPSVEVYAIEYEELDEASGVLAAARYRHWFLLQPNDSRKRLEAGLRVGTYMADSDAWSYSTVRPELGVSYRIGSKPQLGTWDLALRGYLDWREYDDADVDADDIGSETLTNIGGEVSYWTCRWSALGLYAEYTVRDSDRVDRDYDRVQVGGRISAAW